MLSWIVFAVPIVLGIGLMLLEFKRKKEDRHLAVLALNILLLLATSVCALVKERQSDETIAQLKSELAASRTELRDFKGSINNTVTKGTALVLDKLENGKLASARNTNESPQRRKADIESLEDDAKRKHAETIERKNELNAVSLRGIAGLKAQVKGEDEELAARRKLAEVTEERAKLYAQLDAEAAKKTADDDQEKLRRRLEDAKSRKTRQNLDIFNTTVGHLYAWLIKLGAETGQSPMRDFDGKIEHSALFRDDTFTIARATNRIALTNEGWVFSLRARRELPSVFNQPGLMREVDTNAVFLRIAGQSKGTNPVAPPSLWVGGINLLSKPYSQVSDDFSSVFVGIITPYETVMTNLPYADTKGLEAIVSRFVVGNYREWKLESLYQQK